MREHLALIQKLHLKSVLGIEKRGHKMIKSLIPTEHQVNFKIINSLECNLIPPSVNHLYQTYSKNGKIIRTMTKEGLHFKRALSLLAKAKKFKLIEGDCSLEYTLYCSKKGRTDLDNTLKAIQDSLEGIAYKNDSQIVEIVARKIRNSNRDGFHIVVRSAK